MNHITPSSMREDLGEAVRATAMLADVTIAFWSGERTDTQLMDKIKAEAGAVGNVGRTIKNLLAGADGKLKETKSAFTAVRTLHYSLTLPWVSDPHAQRQTGPRLLPNMLFERYLGALSKQKRVAQAALDAFITDYPDAVERAKANLGGLADAKYPAPEEIRSLFRVGFDFEPIPAGSSFRGLPDHMLEKLAAGLKSKQDRMIGAATAAMWEEVRTRVRHITERLVNPDAVFRTTTVENVRELVTLLPGWNLGGDPRVDEIVADIQAMLEGVDAKDLRDDAIVRQDAAVRGQRIADKLSQWGL